MTTTALDAQIGSARRAWPSLLWLVPLLVLWIAFNYAVPVIAASGMTNVAVRVFIHMLIGLGFWLGLERTELNQVQRRDTWLGVMIPVTLWLAVIWSAALNGVFRADLSPTSLIPLALFLPVIIGVPILLRSQRMGQVLDSMPATWLVALQVYRVFGSGFLIGWVLGVAPGVFALPAGIGDVMTGLLAVPVAISLAAGTIGSRKAAIAWNIFGLLDFVVAVGIAQAIALQLIVPSIPNTALGLYPNVMIPTFAVPSSILLHTLSLRQLYRRASREKAATPASAPALA
ncbi:MAG TPA: hypothetical protein VKB68_18785 [Stellaceae bacterium]|nr:hypothetical protein [Stellaceae bacterium]